MSLRKICLLLLSAMLMCCCSCSEQNPQAKRTYDPNADYYICTTSSMGKVHEVKDGLYRMEDTASEDYVMMYADKSDMTNWVYLCNKPNCNHTDEGCNAFMGASFPVSIIYDNHIYYDDGQALYRMNMDGSNHEKVRSLPGAEENTFFMGTHKGVYKNRYILCTITGGAKFDEKKELRIYDLSLTNKKKDILLYEEKDESAAHFLPYYTSYLWLNYQGSFILLHDTESDEKFYRYNVSEKSLTAIEPDQLYKDYSYFEQNLCYYYDHGFKTKNMDTDEITEITDAVLEDGEGKITDRYMIEFLERGSKADKKKLIIYDKEGKQLNEINLKNPSDIEDSVYQVFWASDRLFISMTTYSGNIDTYYVLYDDIGKKNVKLDLSYTVKLPNWYELE